MTTRNRTNKAQLQTSDQNLLNGLQKHEATIPTLLIAGTAVPTTSLVSTLQLRMATRAATAVARAAFQAAVQAEQAEATQSKGVVSGTKQALKVMFSGQIEVLADFGLTGPKARTPLTPEEKVAANAKALATRAARHTLGPKQKAKITGANPAPVAAPSPAPAAAPVAAAPVAAPATPAVTRP
jgi:ribonuclease E